ncbi:MarR family winged helix-turn-helix transcriptional regulator [Gaiella sp.]|uniref:MarR family winged helix-turn-helix transcriptional regulator n=1 Tax=Gaiella sp. TaxID=2663207 RepID=UPI002E32BA42|nr:MarR family winged helix-turn-helix transcriptional regulator [Gaiella sp.]HEX5582948.1 MarR family winged helix-turn-helix transcriptional regulator [Gaiella sp.]
MSEANPQTAPERRLSLLLLVLAANQRLGRLVERELAADGIAAADYGLLSLVGARGPVRLTEVATELGMRLTTASDAMRRLEARGHATRGPNPEDGRSVLFALTAEGDAEWRRGWPALQRITRFLGDELGDPGRVRSSLESLGAAFAEGLARQTLDQDDPKP